MGAASVAEEGYLGGGRKRRSAQPARMEDSDMGRICVRASLPPSGATSASTTGRCDPRSGSASRGATPCSMRPDRAGWPDSGNATGAGGCGSAARLAPAQGWVASRFSWHRAAKVAAPAAGFRAPSAGRRAIAVRKPRRASRARRWHAAKYAKRAAVCGAPSVVEVEHNSQLSPILVRVVHMSDVARAASRVNGRLAVGSVLDAAQLWNHLVGGCEREATLSPWLAQQTWLSKQEGLHLRELFDEGVRLLEVASHRGPSNLRLLATEVAREVTADSGQRVGRGRASAAAWWAQGGWVGE